MGQLCVLGISAFWLHARHSSSQFNNKFSSNSVTATALGKMAKMSKKRCQPKSASGCMYIRIRRTQPRTKVVETGQSQVKCWVSHRWAFHKGKAVYLSLSRFYHIAASDSLQNCSVTVMPRALHCICNRC